VDNELITYPRGLEKAIACLECHINEEIDLSSLKSFHCAVIYSGGKLLSTGFNSDKLNSFVTTFAHHSAARMHAEVNAVLLARKKIDLRGAKMYVAKIGRNGELGNSKPCAMCMQALKLYGIKRVTYTMGDNNFDIEKLSQSQE
jgi:tRNA(Arg) A34 adenosine deaminase TadA